MSSNKIRFQFGGNYPFRSDSGWRAADTQQSFHTLRLVKSFFFFAASPNINQVRHSQSVYIYIYSIWRLLLSSSLEDHLVDMFELLAVLRCLTPGARCTKFLKWKDVLEPVAFRFGQQWLRPGSNGLTGEIPTGEDTARKATTANQITLPN